MDFTVIICTYNRAHNLPHCLYALARQIEIQGIDWQVLVVDNNSTDNTPNMVRKLAIELPIAIRYEREAQQGLNYARNTGIRASDSTYFSYIDDDIKVNSNWLSSIYAKFLEADADAVGGRIHLDPSIKLPKWIRPDTDMRGFLGYQDLGEAPLQLDGVNRYPFGGNMAFHRRVVERIGYFNPLLGRRGSGFKRTELFKGAETDYFRRLATTGNARIFYEPKAIVYHQVLPVQLKKKYFRTIHYNAGYQRAYFDESKFPHLLFRIPRYFYPVLMRMTTKYIGQVILKGPDWAFRQQMNVANLCGIMMGYRNRWKRHAKNF